METITSILNQHGFNQIADIRYKFQGQLWWDEEHYFQVLTVVFDRFFMVRATKSYQMLGISEKGETRARDLPGLHHYLETRVPIYHISASSYRDISPSMLRQNFTDLDPIKSKIESLQNELNKAAVFAARVKSTKKIYQKLLTQEKREIDKLRQQGQQAYLQNQKNEKLSHELAKKGHATSYLFSISSDLLSGSSTGDFQDALSMVSKEILDIHKYAVTQTLQGGRLQIYIAEVRRPDLAFQVEWAGGVLNPNQLGDEFSELRNLVEESLMVHPSSDIPGGQEKKLMGAKILQDFLLKLERMEAPTDIPKLPQEGGWIGNLMLGDKITNIPVFLPVTQNHGYASGPTGQGKSIIVRVYTENSILNRVNILHLDSTLQGAGLGLPNQKEEIFERYEQLGIDKNKARGFKIKFHTPPLQEPYELTTGVNVVSFKNKSKKDQYRETTKILGYIHREYIERGIETDKVRLLIVLEEAATFLGDKMVRELIDVIGRGGRKYGVILLIATQQLADFKYDTKSIRDNVQQRFFLRSTDGNEINYAKDTLGEKAERLRELGIGQAIIDAPGLDGVKVFIRPPFSHVGEPTEDELREINGDSGLKIIGYTTPPDVNDIEAKILDFLKEVWQFSKNPVPASHIEEVLELSNSTCNRILNKMAEKRLIKKEKIAGKTKPSLGIKYIPGVG